MPTPRRHGGSALAHIPLNLPGFRGLNKQSKGAILGPDWATRLENTVIDANNRLAPRKGFDTITTVAAAGNFREIIEYDNGGSKEIIAVGDDSIMYKSTNEGSTWTDVTNTATITDLAMHLIIYNDVLMGFQDGGTVIVYAGTSFTDLAATGEPGGNAALSASGRVFAKDNPTTMKWCALLDHTDWNGADTGSFDFTSVWRGQDEISAIAEFNNAIVVFARNSIVILNDNVGSALGIDPAQAVVVDTLQGIGCIARDSIENVKGDLWFLDDTGLHSLQRLIIQKSNPLQNLSTTVQDEIKIYVSDATALEIKGAYSPNDNFYILALPRGTSAQETGAAFVFDTRQFLEDGSARCAGIWFGMVPQAMQVRESRALMMARKGQTGEVGNYSGFQDDGEGYVMNFEASWTDLDDPGYKMLKRISGLVLVQATVTVAYKWAFDFQDSFKTATVTYTGSDAVPGEWNISEWNLGEWGVGERLQDKNVAGRGFGEYIKIGFSVNINGAAIAFQQVGLYAKTGRIK